MTEEFLIPRLIASLYFMANGIVCAAAIRCYQQRPLWSVLLIAISTGLGAGMIVISWMAETSSPGFWYFVDFADCLGLVLWTIGICRLLWEFAGSEKGAATER
jgi:peptidoglycan/LPS O-acetylase OafA/YrhL